MATGPKPMSTEEKLAKGITKPSRVNFDVPMPSPPAADKLKCPAELKGAGRKLWEEHAQAMTDAGMLKASDMPMFLERCRLQTDLEYWIGEKKGRNVEERYKIDRMINALRITILRLSTELGMTSVSRSKVRAGKRKVLPKNNHKNIRFFGVVNGGKEEDKEDAG